MIKKEEEGDNFFLLSSFILFFLLHLRGSGVSVVNDRCSTRVVSKAKRCDF